MEIVDELKGESEDDAFSALHPRIEESLLVRCVKCRKVLVNGRGVQMEAYKDAEDGSPWCLDCWREHREAPLEGERAEAWDIWQDIKKQYSEGKLS